MLNLYTTRYSYYNNKSGIYRITIGEKFYIGSSKNLSDRLSNHKCTLKRNKHPNQYMQNCFNKYGRDYTYYEIIELCDEDKRLEREEFYIHLLKPELNIITDVFSNPSVPVGKRSNEKIVYQYSLNGDFINEYLSTEEAGRCLNLNGNIISRCASQTNEKVKSTGGFLWSYTKEEKLNQYLNNSSKAKIKAVSMYDLSGKKLKRFDSIAEAAKEIIDETENFNSLCAIISSVAGGKGIRVKNKYRFSYDDLESLSEKFQKQSLPIIQVEKNGNEVYWNNAVEAAKTLNISVLGIHRVLRNERKKYKNSYWKSGGCGFKIL